VALVTWRYLWSTTPLHRLTESGDVRDGPPPLPEHLIDSHNQLPERGTGPLYHRLFTVDITGASRTPAQLVAELAADLNKAVPGEVASVESPSTGSKGLHLGKSLTVRIPGPWNGPVRVVHHDATSFRLATLNGHMEAGQIEFRAREHPNRLRFEIETWARAATPTVNLLYTRLWIAREIQLNMWVRFCLSAARLAGGHPHHGITIRTRVVDEPGPLAAHHTKQRDQGQPTMPIDTFPFRFTRAYRLAGLPFGITPATTEVRVQAGELAIRFGPWRLRTPLDNVRAHTLTGPFNVVKTAGPAHLSFADRGITLATNPDQGLCIQFHRPVGGIEPTHTLCHPSVTVTVADCRGLAKALSHDQG
jgi:hypothetical protein